MFKEGGKGREATNHKPQTTLSFAGLTQMLRSCTGKPPHKAASNFRTPPPALEKYGRWRGGKGGGSIAKHVQSILSPMPTLNLIPRPMPNPNATRYPLPATRYPLPATRYPLPATRYPLPANTSHNANTSHLSPLTSDPLASHLSPSHLSPLTSTL